MESKQIDYLKDVQQFTDPFQMKTFSINDDFVADFSSMSSEQKQSIIPTADESLNETNYFSTVSDQTTNSEATSELHITNLTDQKQESIDLQQTVIDNYELNKEFIKITINQSNVQDNTIDQSDEQSNLQLDLNERIDTLNSNLEIDPFDLNINSFECLNKDDPFKDDLFDVSRTNNSKFDEVSSSNQLDNGNSDAKSKFEIEEDFKEFNNEETRTEVEFNELSSNVIYLEPDSLEKQGEYFIEINSFEKQNDDQLDQFMNRNSIVNKLENILEADKESNSDSEDDLEIESIQISNNEIDLKEDNEIKSVQMSTVDENKMIKKNEIIEQWKVDNEKRIREHDEEELKMYNALRETAKKELDDWYANYQKELKFKKENNR